MKLLYSYGRMKEEIAANRPAVALAGGAAMSAEVLQFPKKGTVDINGHRYETRDGRNLDANEAHRIVAQVSLGKKSILFRLGNHPGERDGILEELGIMLRRAKDKKGDSRWGLDTATCRIVAASAIYELTVDQCFKCQGAGEVRAHENEDLEGKQPMMVCPTCHGARRWRYTEDQRIAKLAEEWILLVDRKTWDDAAIGQRKDMISTVGASLRKNKKIGDMLSAIDWGKGKLIECERVAAQETGAMLERMLA